MKKQIIKKLESMGYEVIPYEVKKNGIIVSGEIIQKASDNPSISPISSVFYFDELVKKAEIQELTTEEVVNDILEKVNSPIPFSADEISSKEYIVNNLFVGMQRKEDIEDIIRKPYEVYPNIECYMYVNIPTNSCQSASYKIHKEILKDIGISEEEAWKIAEENTFKESAINTMIIECFPEMVEGLKHADDESCLHFLTNKTRYRGTASILNKNILMQFSEAFKTKKLVAMPSSIHEFIIRPYISEEDLQMLSQMVKRVNEQEVDPVEQLADEAFVITLE